jgi:hypothetical protein
MKRRRLRSTAASVNWFCKRCKFYGIVEWLGCFSTDINRRLWFKAVNVLMDCHKLVNPILNG